MVWLRFERDHKTDEFLYSTIKMQIITLPSLLVNLYPLKFSLCITSTVLDESDNKSRCRRNYRYWEKSFIAAARNVFLNNVFFKQRAFRQLDSIW